MSSAARGAVPAAPPALPGAPGEEAAGPVALLAFQLHGMRFTLPAERVLEAMTLSGERWRRMVEMAKLGTLGQSGLPLIRLSARLGLEPPRTERGALVLFGTADKVRATLLIDDIPERTHGRVTVLPDAWRAAFGPCEDMIGGVARLADGAQAAAIDLAIGVAARRASPACADRHDSAHLLVRTGRAELEAVRVASLSGIREMAQSQPEAGPRMLLLLGGAGETLAVDEVVGLAPEGRIERLGEARMLVTPSGRYRLLEPDATAPVAMEGARILLTAPAGEARMRLGDLVRSMGHRVSLADDPRAARLVGGRFDILLFDLDAYDASADRGMPTRARRIGVSSAVFATLPPGFEAVVPAQDPVALVAALLQTRARAA
ncbi:chemotaxis protein CheW [Ancylobacter tetraedralis]|nr:chemotaxis protein CheW [Ancylobacter tetraedralis]